MDYLSYLLHGLKIFIIIFFLGNFIDKRFKYFQEKYEISKSKIYGLLHLIVVITIAYIIHVNTSDSFSTELQIYNPTILFSSLMLNIQKTMFYNLDLI